MASLIALLSGLLTGALLGLAVIAWLTATTEPAKAPGSALKPPFEVYPFCPNRPFGQVQTYYPCQYSDREFSA